MQLGAGLPSWSLLYAAGAAAVTAAATAARVCLAASVVVAIGGRQLHCWAQAVGGAAVAAAPRAQAYHVAVAVIDRQLRARLNVPCAGGAREACGGARNGRRRGALPASLARWMAIGRSLGSPPAQPSAEPTCGEEADAAQARVVVLRQHRLQGEQARGVQGECRWQKARCGLSGLGASAASGGISISISSISSSGSSGGSGDSGGSGGRCSSGNAGAARRRGRPRAPPRPHLDKQVGLARVVDKGRHVAPAHAAAREGRLVAATRRPMGIRVGAGVSMFPAEAASRWQGHAGSGVAPPARPRLPHGALLPSRVRAGAAPRRARPPATHVQRWSAGSSLPWSHDVSGRGHMSKAYSASCSSTSRTCGQGERPSRLARGRAARRCSQRVCRQAPAGAPARPPAAAGAAGAAVWRAQRRYASSRASGPQAGPWPPTKRPLAGHAEAAGKRDRAPYRHPPGARAPRWRTPAPRTRTQRRPA